MELPKNINPSEIENKWYQHWLNKNYFHSEPDDREPYTIVIPPPNVTGVLHMGHMLNNTIQDVLIRKARMQGKNACWVPGTDHASIATEAKVVAMLKEKGIDKKSISREEFLKYAWEWKEKYGGIILKQLEKLGASCDWQRTKFTMDESLSEAVRDVFIDLYNKGEIYRGVRMVNWDPVGKTAVSDEEVIHKEVNSKLYYIQYVIDNEENKQEYITIATTRPETILGDTAICVHPNDERYQNLKGKYAIVPLINRKIPIIFDEYIDIEFGTGALKVTPAHDINDYNLGIKHKLEVIDILNDDGTLNEKAQLYIGEDRFAVRKKIAIALEEKNYLVKIEDIKNKVGFSERTDAVIEPKLSMQWFLKMDEMAKPALENVLNNNIKLIPEKFKNTYKHWMENVHDWCISRQLWWGHRIPAWHHKKDGRIFVGKSIEEVIKKNNQSLKPLDGFELAYDRGNITYEELKQEEDQYIAADELVQDEDVLDTWFSSWLWPISVFDGFNKPDGKDINYYYPTNDLITAPEILFFWVARMIMAGYEYKNEKPFKNVYLTGIVRDKQGRKMSKSLGNSPDPLDLIEKYGADGVRTGMLFSSPAGNDLLFDEKSCEQGRNFTNKIWNALRLVKGWEVEAQNKESANRNKDNAAFDSWFENKLNHTIETTTKLYEQYRLSEVLTTLYSFIWDDFCSWYLEYIKPPFGEKIDAQSYQQTIEHFKTLIKLMHPFMPFITEEIYHHLESNGSDIIVSQYPMANSVDETAIANGEKAKKIVSAIRDIRNKNGLSPKQTLKITVQCEDESFYKIYESAILKLANIEPIEFTTKEITNSMTQLIDKDKVYIITGIELNKEDEKQKLEKEIEYYKGFISSIEKKLSNEKFVQNAKPEVIENERKKLADGQSKLESLQNAISGL